MSKPAQQPKTIKHGGQVYTLHLPLKVLANGISEGPYYSRPGVDPADWAFMPDTSYLLGQSTEPSFMHCIQQRPEVKTKHPSAVS